MGKKTWRIVAKYGFTVALDNHEPTRNYGTGTLVERHDDDGNVSVVLETRYVLRDAHKSLYLLDDGETVRPFYVAGWQPDGVDLYLQPFPTNPGGVKRRPDNGDVVNYSLWLVGPRRTYHLKLT